MFEHYRSMNQGMLLRLESLQTSLLWITAAVALTCAILLRLVYLAYLHPLAGYPGPKLWAISRIPWAYHVIKGDVWHSMDRFHTQYGPIVRIAPDELTYITPEAWKDIYSARPQLLKDPYSLTPPMNNANSLFTAEGDEHRRIRGAVISAFSDKALREQSVIIEEYACQFVKRLKTELNGNPSGIIDLQPIFGYATFDIISDLTWGESPKALQTAGEHSWYGRFFLHAKFSRVRNCLSRFYGMDSILHYVFLRITSKQRAANTKLTFERIDRRLASGNLRSDLMTPIIGKISEDGCKGTITKSEVLTNGVATVIAGSQLSTIAITTAVYLLLRNPNYWQSLAKEVRGAGFKDEGDISVTSTQSLELLKAVVNEAMRIHHPTPGSLPRVTPRGGTTIAGRPVPSGIVVGVSLYNIHTRHENFYKQLEFHPERFLDTRDVRYDPAFADDRIDAFHPFSTGPRNCIGSKLFLAEARVIFARLVWTFDIALAELDQSSWLDQKAWLVCEPKPLRVKISLR